MPIHAVPIVTGPTVLAYAPRERSRALLKGAFPKRRGRLLLAKNPAEFAVAFQDGLIDAANVGGALLPAVRDGGRVVALRAFDGEPERGDVVVFEDPGGLEVGRSGPRLSERSVLCARTHARG